MDALPKCETLWMFRIGFLSGYRIDLLCKSLVKKSAVFYVFPSGYIHLFLLKMQTNLKLLTIDFSLFSISYALSFGLVDFFLVKLSVAEK